ncbi:hypothetical protein C3L33_22432, partial [Rhododendron williamsianum]
MASRALEPIRLSAELSIQKNNANIGLMVSRWSKDTHTFVFPWEDGGPTLQDTAVLMRLSTRGLVAFDPSNLSSADARLVDRLRKAYTARASAGPALTERDAYAPLRSQMYDSDLHLAGFLVYWLSFFVIPDFPYEGPNHTVFPLAVSLAWGDFVPLGPLFLGSLFHRLDQVHADTERSLGCYDMVSVVHMQFLMAFCFEHFPSLAPSPANFSWNEEPRPRIMRWSGVSSTKSWGKQIDDAGTFFPRPYAKLVEGALTTSFFSESDRIVDFQTVGAAVGASALSAFAAACPCSLPALCAEGMRSVLYRPDRVARQFGYDQGAPGPAPPLRSYVVSLRRFTRAFAEELSEGYNIVVLPRKDRETFFTANSRLAWRRNLDSFINYVRGLPEIPAFSDVYHRDVSLRPSVKAAVEGCPCSSSEDPLLRRSSCEHRVCRLFVQVRRGEGEHTPLSKLKRKRKCEETREEGSDSSIDDTVPISQSFKLPRTTQPSPDGTSVATGKKLALEAVVQQPSSQEVIETALNLLDKRVFADLQDDSFISLGILQAGYAAEAVSEDSSLLAGGSASQQQVEASTSREHVAADDYFVVQVVESPVVNEMEELSNEAFFGYYGFTHEATSFFSFVRDLFPYTFFKVRDLYSRTMGRMQLECLYTFLRSVKGMRVCDLGPNQIEEVGLTVQNFDKLGFDIWWVYKELEAAKVMRENEQLWRDCEGPKAALEEARAALAEAQSAVAAAEAVVEERRLVFDRLAEESRLGDRLDDVPLCDIDPFLKMIFGA